MADSLFAHPPIKSLGHGLNVPGFSLLWRPIKGPKALQKEKRPLQVAFLLVHKELIIKLALFGTTGLEYNQFEGAGNEKRWDAYKNREERKTNDEPYL